MFSGFRERIVDTGEVHIRALVSGGSDKMPSVVLLHGYPQTSAAWHAVAPVLAQKYRVVCVDLRGYGQSSKPLGLPNHENYSKRAMANDVVAVMNEIGDETFSVVGHDRGARVAHRLAQDHPHRVSALCLIDIAPTVEVFERVNAAIANGYFHWWFLSQPAGLPESLLRTAPHDWVTNLLTGFGRTSLRGFARDALAEYQSTFADPACIHSTCEDYRASATIDLHDDRQARSAGVRVTCPTHLIWGKRGLMKREFVVDEVWAPYIDGSFTVEELDAGHFIPDESPDLLTASLAAFLEKHIES
ncbi:hypothetical protein B1790_01090 [Mycobacterium sp. AT1]|nr:hypothetical protein B1790_01090 [Mycobacterium sp. AT1]